MEITQHVETYAPRSGAAYEKAEAEGLVVDLPRESELQLDFDTLAQLEAFRVRLQPILMEHFGVIERDVLVTVSKSGHWHVRVALPLKRLTPIERIAFQAACGSDPVRELLSLVMIDNHDSQPTLLHEKPETMASITAWRGRPDAPLSSFCEELCA
jgi:hypothetical protein